MHDLLILGGGIAGLTAAIYAARARLGTVLLERGFTGGQALETPEIENYPGVPHTDGMTLSMTISDQAKALGADIRTATVTGWQKTDTGFSVQAGEDTFEAHCLLIATGATHRPLDVPGEDALRGRGVSYCATCDGRFFRGKTVAVVGGGNTAAEDALYLARLCERVVLIHRRDRLRASKALAEQVLASENITVLWNTTVQRMDGESRLESLHLLTDGGESTLAVDGVFVAVGIRPNSELFLSLPHDESGFLSADENGETTVPGVFVAGDIREKRCRQLITAAGDGAAAVSAIERYLSTL